MYIFTALIETGSFYLNPLIVLYVCCWFIKNAATTKLLRQMYRFHIYSIRSTHCASGGNNFV